LAAHGSRVSLFGRNVPLEYSGRLNAPRLQVCCRDTSIAIPIASGETGSRPRMRQRFEFETSPRRSRNSLGPLRRCCFRISRSSSGVDGSISLSSSTAANSSALDAASRFRRRKGFDAANTSSSSRRIACERELTPFSSAHLSISAVSFGDNRMAENGSWSGGPRSFRLSIGFLGRFIRRRGMILCLSEQLAAVLGH
jgi:hypothetical protein